MKITIFELVENTKELLKNNLDVKINKELRELLFSLNDFDLIKREFIIENGIKITNIELIDSRLVEKECKK